MPEKSSRGSRIRDDRARARAGLPVGWTVSCRFLGRGFRRGFGPSHGAPLQFDAMCIVEEAIADRVSLVRVADDAVPVGDRELAGNQDGGAFAAFLDDFDQVPAFGIA